jgi:hypothetical protein
MEGNASTWGVCGSLCVACSQAAYCQTFSTGLQIAHVTGCKHLVQCAVLFDYVAARCTLAFQRRSYVLQPYWIVVSRVPMGLRFPVIPSCFFVGWGAGFLLHAPQLGARLRCSAARSLAKQGQMHGLPARWLCCGLALLIAPPPVLQV